VDHNCWAFIEEGTMELTTRSWSGTFYEAIIQSNSKITAACEDERVDFAIWTTRQLCVLAHFAEDRIKVHIE
jgi:hypothetical protein